ncbi:MAG TPA: hypothetical protein VG734_04600 [Lacunisphaera sp.]|nr:hypothetical protein [Lacunisphaera sp.]
MKPEVVPTFVQNSRIHRTIYQIRGNELAISVLNPRGNGFSEFLVDLRTVDSNYQPRAVRLYLLVLIPGAVAVLSGLVIWGLMQAWGLKQLAVVPREVMVHFLLWPAIIFAMSLAFAIRGTRRVEYYQFLNQWKRPAFQIICEREQRAECAAFISALVAHIELAQSDLPEAERRSLLERVAAETHEQPAPATNGWRWKLSLGCGALAAGLPLWPGSAGDTSLVVILFPLCALGLIATWLSFAKREPGRWWSLAGAALALFPPFFY